MKKLRFGKRIICLILSLVLVVSSIQVQTEVQAEELQFEVGNLAYTEIADKDHEVLVSATKDKSMTSLTIPASVEYEGEQYKVTGVAKAGFSKCKKLETVIISNGITEIQDQAFEKCYELKTVSFPDSVTRIGEEAFSYNEKLENVQLPKELKLIGIRAFEHCDSITEITIPKTLDVEADENNFYGSGPFGCCATLEKANFEEGRTRIPNYIFAGCHALKNTGITDSITEIGAGAYLSCSSIEELNLHDNITRISQFAFDGCESIKEVKIPSKITVLETAIFSNCTSLEKAEIPDDVTEMKGYVFSGDTSLKEVCLPAKVKSLGDNEFENCSALKELSLPMDVTTLGDGVFSGCSSLTNFFIPNTLEKCGSYVFANCTNLTDIAIEDGTKTIFKGMLSYIDGLKEITIPESVTKIESKAFYQCTNLVKINLPSNLKQIESYTFGHCKSLESVDIPNGLQIIKDYAFLECEKLMNVEFPNSVCYIGKGAFNQCKSISSVALPGVKNIYELAFAETDNLKSVYLPADTSVASDSFDVKDDLEIHVPKYSKTSDCLTCHSILSILEDDKEITDKSILDRKYTSIVRNNSKINGSTSLTVNYKLKDDYIDDPTRVYMFGLRVPSGSKIESIYSEGKILESSEYELSGNGICIYTSKTSGKYVVNLKEADNQIIGYSAVLLYNDFLDPNYKQTDIIGTIVEKTALITVKNKVDFETGDSEADCDLTVSAAPNSSVTVYVDDNVYSEFLLPQNGLFSGTIKLSEVEDRKEYKIKVVVNTGEREVETTKTVRVYENIPKLISAKIIFLKNGATFDIGNENMPPYFRVDPSYGYEYVIKYTYPEKIGRVYVESKKGGSVSKIVATWDEKRQAFVTHDFFDDSSRHIPENISIKYTKKYEEDKFLNDDGTPYLTQEQLEEMPEIWKDVEIEENKITTSDFEANLKFKDGKIVKYRYDYMSMEDYFNIIKKEALSEDLSQLSVQQISDDGKEAWNTFKKQYPTIAKKISRMSYDEFCRMVRNQDFSPNLGLTESEKKVILYAFNPEDEAHFYLNATMSFAGEQADGYLAGEVENYLGLKGNPLSVASAVCDDFKTVGDVSRAVGDSYEAKQKILNDPNLTDEEKANAINAINRNRNIKMESGFLSYLANGLTICGFATAETGVGLFLGVAGLALSAFNKYYVETGDLDNAINDYNYSAKDIKMMWMIDPSGYIYDSVLTNRIEGAKTTIYYKPTKSSSDCILWDAKEYGQVNPIITDNMGRYAWDVPEGYWQVKAEKEGYETAYSEWLPVPPIQLDVNLELIHKENPKVSEMVAYESYALVKFNQYVDPTNIEDICLKDANGNTIKTEITYDNSETNKDGKVFIKEAKLTYKDGNLKVNDKVVLFLSNTICNNGKKPLETAYVVSKVKGDVKITCDCELKLAVKDTYQLHFNYSGNDIKDVKASIDNQAIVSASEVKTGYNDYYIELTGLVLGDATLTLSADNGNVKTLVPIAVDDKTVAKKKEISESNIEATNIIKKADNKGNVTIVEPTMPDLSGKEETTINNNGEKTTLGNKENNDKVVKKDKKVTPGKAKIAKVFKKKKSAKILKVKLAKIKNAKGYQVAVFKTKKDAKLFKKAVVKKFTTKLTCTIKSNKLKNKKKLFVAVRAYTLNKNVKVYGKVSDSKNVKIK